MLVIFHPPTFRGERAYIHDVLFRQFLGLDYLTAEEERSDVRIAMAADADGKELRLADVFFAQPEEDWLTPRSLPPRPLPRWTAGEGIDPDVLVSPQLPVLYGKPCENGGFFRADDNRVEIGLDIAGSSFFLLTRYEEMVNPERDSHRRFPARASLAWQEGFLDRPIVHEYLEILWWGMKRLWPGLARKSRKFRILPSHDVDQPFGVYGASSGKLWKNMAGDLLYRKSPSLLWRRTKSVLAVRRGNPRADLNQTFDWIMEQSERHGLVSAFYFFGGHTDRDVDGVYELGDPLLVELLRRIHRRGHEIGLHPSYHTFRDGEQLKREYASLRQAAQAAGIDQKEYGGRQHYLRWEAPATWQIWADAGLAYDSTLGYPDHAGFRCGTCREFPVYDACARKVLPLRERPLIVMECTLLERQYMNMDRDAAADYMQMLKRRCQKYQGDFTLLWHNDRLVHPQDAELYQFILQA